MRTVSHRSHRVALLILAVALLFVASPRAHAAPRVYRDRVEPHWIGSGGDRFWYRNDLPGGAREFILVDARRATRERAFDHARVAASLAKATGRNVAADKLPIDSLDFEKAAGAGAIVLNGVDGTWQLDLESYAVVRREDLKPSATADGAQLPSSDRPRPSRSGGVETVVIFENRTDAAVEVFWLDTGGERRHYLTIAPGERQDRPTFAGHVWLVTDRDGRTLGVFEATPRPATAVIGGKKGADAPAAKPSSADLADDGTSGAAFDSPEVDADAALEAPGADDANADSAPAASRSRGRRGGRGSSPQSPDGKWLAIVKEYNLYIRNRESGEEIALSDDGKETDAYDAERVRWSPDSKKLVAMRIEPAEKHTVYRIESSPKDQVQPKLLEANYLKPGDRIAHPRPQLFDVASRRHVPVKEDLFPTPWSIDDVRWAADSSRFTFVYNQRGHQVLRVVAVDAKTGEASAIVDEKSATFIDYSGKFHCEWIGDDELVWMSERDGWNHLWLYDAKAGRVKSQITRGEWVVQRVTRLDVDKRQVWFTAGGVRPGQDPYYAHACRINLDGSGLTILTEGDGTHTVNMAPGGEFFLDTWSRVDQPPITELRKASDGSLIKRLEEADANEVLAERGGRWPEPFVARGRDGKTDIYGVIFYPRDFKADAKYPVVEEVYAGPHGFNTLKMFRRTSGRVQKLADMGAIVVMSDGMGTSGRSKAFHDVCWKNLKDAGFPDRIAWIKAAAAKHPQMDLSRVGIYGGSAGGQNAVAALLWHNDFYKVAVADCGCHDNRMDKIWWNEQWMGWPVDASYAASSNAVSASLMKGKLMLVVGELDDNVDPASTMQVVNALEKADKDFDLVVITGARHGAAETPYGSRRRAQFFARHLLGRDG